MSKHAGSRVAAPPPMFFKFLLNPECMTRVKYKIDHILKTKNGTKKLVYTKNPILNIAHLLRCPNFFWSVKNTCKLWTRSLITQKIKIEKLIFHFQDHWEKFFHNKNAMFRWQSTSNPTSLELIWHYVIGLLDMYDVLNSGNIRRTFIQWLLQ